jgi:sugar phosphate permease
MASGLERGAPVSELSTAYPPRWRANVVWLIPAAFYLAAFYLRAAPAVMTAELMRDFHIGAVALGNLSAFYFYAYVLMQIPTGILVDFLGARRLLVIGSIAAAAGTLLFGSTDNLALACLGRAIVGAATAVGWVVTLKITTHWFPSRLFAMLTGVGLLVGNIGNLLAQVPLRLLVEAYGWRFVVMASAGVILAIGGLAWLIVRNDPSEAGYTSYAPASIRERGDAKFLDLLRGFRKIFLYRNTWLIFTAQGGFVGAILSFTGLWGPPYLRARFDLKPTGAAAVCSVMIVCWAVACPICGHLSDRIGKRKPIYLAGAIVAALGWASLFLLPGLPLAVFVAIAAVTSFAIGAVILGFAFARESVPVQYLGTISGLINMGNMTGTMILQPAIGYVLDKQWAGTIVNGTRVYGPKAFETAFLLIIGWAVVSVFAISLTQETGCRQGA